MRAVFPTPRRRRDRPARLVTAPTGWWTSIGIALMVVAALAAARPRSSSPSIQPIFAAGEVADRDVIAARTFAVKRDAATLKEARRAARGSAPVILVHRESVEFERRAVLDAFYDAITGDPQQAAELSTRSGLGLSDEESVAFAGQSTRARALRRLVDRVVQQLFQLGIADVDLESQDRPIVVMRGGGEEIGSSDIICGPALLRDAERRVAGLVEDPDDRRLVGTLVSAIAEPNLILDERQSELRAQAAEAAVSPIIAEVRAGERIVRAHEVVTPLQAQKLAAYRRVEVGARGAATTLDKFRRILVSVAVLMLLIGCVAGYIWRYRPDIAGNVKKEILLGVLILISALPSAPIISSALLEDVLAPVLLVPVLATILLDAQVAIILTVVTVFIVATYGSGPALFALIALIVSLATIYALNTIRKRSSYYRSILVVVGISIITVVVVDQAYGILLERTAERVVAQAASVVVCFMVALFLLPAFERFSGLTTDLTLNEYADLNHPLLRRLAVRAPGSFHHSIMVANLAEAAATAIDANPLLARVGAYFHDIGKMSKAEYYIENQMGAGNKHDRLAPSMSVLVIQNHVKEGIELAKEHRLPSAIVNFIPEHHGTSVISYFYNKAKSSESRSEVRMDDYRYPGPKPRSRETAIVMIADTAEAASRSLEDPTPLRLEQLINKTIRDKFANGQLDQSNLTLDDLRRIGQAFIPILIGAYHARIEYPETDESQIKELEKARGKRSREERGVEARSKGGT